jgi:fucose permease
MLSRFNYSILLKEIVMKKMLAVVMVVAFALSAGSALAGKVNCTVDKVDGNTVTMTCKKADKLKAGQAVTVKAAKKKAIEGC